MVVEILLHNIRSVYNTASIFRTAECLGVNKIWLSGYTPAPIDRFGRDRSDFHKVALGAEHSIAWNKIDDYKDLLTQKKSQNFEIIGLEQVAGATKLQDFIPVQSVLLIPGTETTGMHKELIASCENFIEITQRGEKESLNVHVATAIACWHLLHRS